MRNIVLKSTISILVIIVIFLISLFLFEGYMNHVCITECISAGRTNDWCEQGCFELRMME